MVTITKRGSWIAGIAIVLSLGTTPAAAILEPIWELNGTKSSSGVGTFRYWIDSQTYSDYQAGGSWEDMCCEGSGRDGWDDNARGSSTAGYTFFAEEQMSGSLFSDEETAIGRRFFCKLVGSDGEVVFMGEGGRVSPGHSGDFLNVYVRCERTWGQANSVKFEVWLSNAPQEGRPDP